MRIVNFILGVTAMIIAIIIFMLVGSLVDGLSLTTFIKWWCFGSAMFGLGMLMYKLSEVGE